MQKKSNASLTDNLFCYFSVPEIRNQRNELVIVDVVEGADVRLFCQVKDKGLKHKLSVYWQKNNITLQTSSFSRIRVKLNRYLTIKKTTKDDRGLYTCVAENTCGGKNVLYIHLFLKVSKQTKTGAFFY